MKKLIKYFIAAVVFIVATLNVPAQDVKSKETTVYFSSNMDCHECELKLNDELRFEKGVKDLKIDLESNTIKVVFKPTKTSSENLTKKIEKIGYDAIPISEIKYNSLVKKPENK